MHRNDKILQMKTLHCCNDDRQCWMLIFIDCIMVFGPVIWCRVFAVFFLRFSQKSAVFLAIFCRDFLLSLLIVVLVVVVVLVAVLVTVMAVVVMADSECLVSVQSRETIVVLTLFHTVANFLLSTYSLHRRRHSVNFGRGKGAARKIFAGKYTYEN